jgi:hypothetical protein
MVAVIGVNVVMGTLLEVVTKVEVIVMTLEGRTKGCVVVGDKQRPFGSQAQPLRQQPPPRDVGQELYPVGQGVNV